MKGSNPLGRGKMLLTPEEIKEVLVQTFGEGARAFSEIDDTELYLNICKAQLAKSHLKESLKATEQGFQELDNEQYDTLDELKAKLQPDEGLREALGERLFWLDHPKGDWSRSGLQLSYLLTIDWLLPIITPYTAAAVKAERERILKELNDYCDDEIRLHKATAKIVETDLEKDLELAGISILLRVQIKIDSLKDNSQ